jgi:ligand-binding sensor domain-containing protein
MKIRPILVISAALLLFATAAVPAELEIITHKTEEEGLPDNSIRALATDGGSGVFVASDAGLHLFLDYFFVPVFQRIAATLVARDPGGDVWAAGGPGLIWHVAPSGDIWTAKKYPFAEKRPITALAARHGALFVGTDGGLFYLTADDRSARPIMKGRAVTALLVAADGTLVAATGGKTAAQKGLVILGGEFAGRTGWVDELSGVAISTLFSDDGRLFIGTEKGTVLILDDRGIQEVPLAEKPGRISALCVSGGLVAVGSERGLFGGRADGPVGPQAAPDGHAIARVTSLAPGPGGTIWVGTHGDGLYLVRIHP